MKITAARNKLLAALGHVQSIVERRSSIPILSNVKVEAKDNKLILVTTDMDIAAEEHMEANVQSPGVTTVPVHMLYDICRKLTDEEIHLDYSEPESSEVILRVSSGEFSLPALSADEFPNFEIEGASHVCRLSSEDITGLFTQTRHAMSFEETRYYLNGIYLHVISDNGMKLRATATDGHRLAQAQIKMPEGLSDDSAVIIPKKTVGEVIKLFESEDGPIELAISDKKVMLQGSKVRLISKIIDGKFPDYQRVIPYKNNVSVEVDVKELTKAIDVVTSVSFEKTKLVRMDLSSGELRLSVTSEMQGNARGSQTIKADYQGEPFVIGFNSKYIMEALSAIEGDRARFKFSDSAGAALVENPENSNILQVLMPMQL